MSDSSWPHRLQHTRLPCPSLSPKVYSNSCPLSWWWGVTISSAHDFFFCLQSSVFSNDLVFLIRWSKYWSFSVHSSSDYSELFPLGLTGLISLKSKGLSGVFSSTTMIVPLICCLLGYTLLFHFKRRKQFVYRKHHLSLCIQILFIISVIENPKPYASWGQQLFMFKFCITCPNFFPVASKKFPVLKHE